MKLLKSMFRNAGIPTTGNFEARDRWEPHMPQLGMTFVDDGGQSGAGGGGDGEGGKGKTEDEDGGKPPAGKSGSLSDSEAKLLQEVMDKKGKLKEATEQLAQVNAKLAEFDGLDPKELRALLAEKKDREQKELEARGQWDTLRQQMAEQHQKELEAERKKTQEEADKRTALERRIDELAISTAFGQSRFIPGELDMSVAKTRVIFGPHFEVQDGNVVGFDKPAGAKDRKILVDSSGLPLPFDVALQKLVDADPDAAQLRKSKLKTGAGSGTERGAEPPSKTTTLTGRERIRAALSARKK